MSMAGPGVWASPPLTIHNGRGGPRRGIIQGGHDRLCSRQMGQRLGKKEEPTIRDQGLDQGAMPGPEVRPGLRRPT